MSVRTVQRQRLAAAIILAASSAGVLPSAHAANKYYVGTGGLWQDGPWSLTPGGPANTSFPMGGSDAGIVVSPTNFTVTTNLSTAMSNIGTIVLDGTGFAVVTLDKTAANNIGCTEMVIGQTGQASFTSGTGSVSAAHLIMGQQFRTYGTAVFGSTSLSIGQSMTIGLDGAGDFRMDSGSLGVANPMVPMTVGSNNLGVFNLNGGSASVGQLLAGSQTQGFGVISINAGNFAVQSTTTFGGGGGAAVFLNGGTVSFGGAVTVQRNAYLYAQGSTLLLSPTSGWTMNGGTADLGSQQYMLNSFTPIVLNDGYFGAANIISLGGSSINWSAGTVALNNADFTPASTSLLGNGSIQLPGTKALYVSGRTTLDAAHPVVLNGGTFSTGSLGGNPANLQFNSGTFRITADEFSIRTDGIFGATYTLDSAHRLEVGNGNSAHIYPEGTLYVTGGALVSEGPFVNEGDVVLASPVAHVGGGEFDNFGVLQGTGRVQSDFFNQIGGEVRINATDTMRFEGGFTNNNGLISLLGGVANFKTPIHNDVSGRITGRGTIQTTEIDNQGTIQLSAGVSDVHGALTNKDAAKTIIAGNSVANFYDAVVNEAGSEFRVASGSTAVFFGPVTGTGQFTGPGVKDFEDTADPGPIATPGSTIVGPSGNVTAVHVREAALSVEGLLTIPANGTPTGVSRVGALDVPGGKINLTNNALIVDHDGASPIAAIKSLIVSGRAGGTWTGDGLTSSLANAGSFALGYAEASALFSTPTMFLGQGIDGTTMLVRFTRYGDANLDGAVNALDFNALATHFGQAGQFWSDADFNYDGSINTADFTALALNFNQALPAPALGTLVPEPASLGLFAVGMGIVRRRRA